MRVEKVPDPRIQEPTDAITAVTTTNICGSDLHLCETLGPFVDKGDMDAVEGDLGDVLREMTDGRGRTRSSTPWGWRRTTRR